MVLQDNTKIELENYLCKWIDDLTNRKKLEYEKKNRTLIKKTLEI